MKKKRSLRNLSLIKNKRARIILPCIILTGLFLFSYFQTRNDNKEVITSSERLAPSFELPDFQGKLHRIEEFRGQFVLLHFWASWCAPCLDEIPQWLELSKTFAKQPLKLIAISLDSNWTDAQKVLHSNQLPSNVLSLLDIHAKIPDLYGTYQFPETYLIGPDQKIKAKWVGPQEWESEAMRQRLGDLIQTRTNP